MNLRTRLPRHMLIQGAVGLSLLLGIVVGLTRDPLTGLITFAALFGPLTFAIQFLPAKPVIVVAPVVQGTAVSVLPVHQEVEIRPIDIDSIISREQKEAYTSMPMRPPPRFPPGSPFSKLTAFSALSLPIGISEEDLRDFERRVGEFGEELRSWIEQYEARRSALYREFALRLRVSEEGSAPAEHLRLKLRFPPGFDLVEAIEPLDAPPRTPRYSRYPFAASGITSPLTRALTLPFQPAPIEPLIRQPGSPTYGREGGAITIAFDLGRINQSDSRETATARLLSAAPGSYSVEWQATAHGLREPVSGSFQIDVAAPEDGLPIETISSLEEEHAELDF